MSEKPDIVKVSALYFSKLKKYDLLSDNTIDYLSEGFINSNYYNGEKGGLIVYHLDITKKAVDLYSKINEENNLKFSLNDAIRLCLIHKIDYYSDETLYTVLKKSGILNNLRDEEVEILINMSNNLYNQSISAFINLIIKL
jgi:hypothetical protein